MAEVLFRDLHKTFTSKSSEINALQDINLEIPSGAIFGVVGTSGAGKSTLLRAINGLEKPTSGTVRVLDQDLGALSKKQLRGLRSEVSMVFQHFNLLETQTVAQNVAMPLVLAKAKKREIDQRVAEVLEMVGLAERADHLPKQLSGGQRQRVGIARALVTNPKILLCDEPTSALDPLTTGQILDLIMRVNEKLGITVIIITHEIGVVARIADTVAVMENGRIIEKGSVTEVFAHPQQPLTRRFVENVLPHSLPDAVQEVTDNAGYGAVVRLVHRHGAAKDLVNHLVNKGISTDISHASDTLLRSGTVRTLVLGLTVHNAAHKTTGNDAQASSLLDEAVRWMNEQADIDVEVVG